MDLFGVFCALCVLEKIENFLRNFEFTVTLVLNNLFLVLVS